MSIIITNSKSLKNVAIIFLKGFKNFDRQEQKEDFVLFYKNDELVSLNVFNANKYFLVTKTQILTKNLIKIIERNINQKIKTYPFFVTCQIKETQIHPKSNKLLVTKVDIGTQIIQIVTNKNTLQVNDKLVVGLENAVLPNGKVISSSNILGIKSFGMFCGYKTLGVKDSEEIIFLKNDLGSIYEF